MSEIDVRKLAEQLDAAQSILDDIRVTCGCNAFGGACAVDSRRTETALEAAKRALHDRRLRTSFLGLKEIFGEPAWDLLLDLFIRQAEYDASTCESALTTSNLHLTTLIRWLKVLEHNGLIKSRPDPADSGRIHVNLTPAGYEGMLRYLESIAQRSFSEGHLQPRPNE